MYHHQPLPYKLYLQDGVHQKKEEQYQKWQNFKVNQRNEKHATLKKKIALQHELIQANDELHFQRQVHEQRRQSEMDIDNQPEILEAERQERRQRQEALTNRGKIDLESERKEARTKRRAERKLAAKLQQTSLEPTEGKQGSTAALGSRKRSVLLQRGEAHGRLSVVSSSDEEEEENGDRFMEEDGEPLIYQQDLQKIFGSKQAAYFLRPRFEPEQKKVIPVPQSLQKQGGRAGVNALWGTLRDDSTVKLQKADSKIPQELKAAYGAFVRECLTHNKTVAKRSFYSEEGIPDGEKLQDGSYHQRVKDVQKKVELMYRAAMTNEDKAAVLLFNNPIPDYNNLKGTEGPLRYHPSWIDEDDSDEDEPTYKKWLREVPSPWPQQLPPLETLPATPSRPQRDGDNDANDDDDSMSWDSLPDIPKDDQPKAAKEKAKPLSFLTEEAATVPGQFRKRWDQKRDATGRFIPGKEVMTRASLGDGEPETKQALSLRKTRSSTAPAVSSSLTSQPRSDGRQRSERKVQTARKDWQPLSLTALEDYKPAVHMVGGGDFAQGQEFMWKPIVATDTAGKP
ncbi:uncharacterized protein LOC117307253 isoform X1 [Asterias rubens]|uniref:uncharacterized protein LOC117307253 isoform X1 n=1 Tax=Asterias rubens TaxID=7604 RepID=UPI0014555F4A|nr:uncharacterized protein LOC117307253 isoform X1 [Asterias rubens]